VALREAKTLLGVFGRLGASFVRPALCLGSPLGPAAALGSGLLLMSMLFYTIRKDWKQPTTCLYVLTLSSLLYRNNKDPCASVWRRSSAPHAPSTGSCSIRVPRSFLAFGTMASFRALSTKLYTSGLCVYLCLQGAMFACILSTSML
jgi:hypothetical protein